MSGGPTVEPPEGWGLAAQGNLGCGISGRLKWGSRPGWGLLLGVEYREGAGLEAADCGGCEVWGYAENR